MERLSKLRMKAKDLGQAIRTETEPDKQRNLISDLHTVRKEIWAIENNK